MDSLHTSIVGRKSGRGLNPQAPDELLVGAPAIARELNQPLRRVYFWLVHGQIKSAVQRGKYYVVSRSALRREFELEG
jgi:hypothetical protein